MNHTARSVGVTITVVLLGVTAAGTAAFGLLAPLIGFGAGDLLGGTLGSAARIAMVALGLVSLLFAAAAAIAARLVHTGQPGGAAIGLTVGAALIAGPVVAAASGGWHPALAASVALGAGLIGALKATIATDARP